jgi:hypothetical protein
VHPRVHACFSLPLDVAAPASAHVLSVLKNEAQDVKVSAESAEVNDCRHLSTTVDVKGEQSVPVGSDQEIHEGLHNFFHTVHRRVTFTT